LVRVLRINETPTGAPAALDPEEPGEPGELGELGELEGLGAAGFDDEPQAASVAARHTASPVAAPRLRWFRPRRAGHVVLREPSMTIPLGNALKWGNVRLYRSTLSFAKKRVKLYSEP
jgi:hypothetical protein